MVYNVAMSIIKDISLAKEGERKIRWVMHNMPILNSIREEFERDLPFTGITVALACHLEAKTAYLCEVFQAGGAKVVCAGSNPFSTKDDVCAALVEHGITVYAVHGCDEDTQKDFLRKVLQERPNIIIDDGGDLMDLVHQEFQDLIPEIIGGCEETTTGVNRVIEMDKAGKLMFPMMLINHADCKHLFDNRYGTGQSSFDAIDSTTNLNMAGRYIVVAGYGWVGKGVALRAKGLAGRVIVTEIDPIKAIEAAMEGYDVMPMAEAAKKGDIFITCTGEHHVIRAEHFSVMKDNAIVCNAGHFGYEIDLEDLKAMAKSTYEARENIDAYELDGDRTVYVIADGNLVNIAAGNGHPADIMDMSFSLQALNARYVREHSEELGPHAIRVPREIDETVALRKLASMGINIDK